MDLHGIPAGLPDGALDTHRSPYMGISRTPAPQPKITIQEVVRRLLATGASFQDVRAVLRERFGVRLSYTGHDREGGKAMARRRRQMAAGKLPGVVTVLSCVCGAPLAVGNTLGLCPVCLERKWSD